MNRQRGFNILELMTIVVIAGILLVVGVPGLQRMVANNRITSQLNQFSSSLALARSEAVKVNQRVVVCPSLSGTDCSAGVDWDVGWITFIDRAPTLTPPKVDDDGGGNPADDPCAIDAGDDNADDCILSYVQGLTPDTMTLRKSTAGDFISYNGLGASNESTLYVLCDDENGDGNYDSGDEPAPKAILISNTGRVSVSTTKEDGSALACTP